SPKATAPLEDGPLSATTTTTASPGEALRVELLLEKLRVQAELLRVKDEQIKHLHIQLSLASSSQSSSTPSSSSPSSSLPTAPAAPNVDHSSSSTSSPSSSSSSTTQTGSGGGAAAALSGAMLEQE